MADTFLSSFVLNEERANLPGLDKELIFPGDVGCLDPHISGNGFHLTEVTPNIPPVPCPPPRAFLQSLSPQGEVAP